MNLLKVRNAYVLIYKFENMKRFVEAFIQWMFYSFLIANGRMVGYKAVKIEKIFFKRFFVLFPRGKNNETGLYCS